MDWRKLLLPLALLSCMVPAASHGADVKGMSHSRGGGQPYPRIMVMLELAPEHYRAGSGYGGAYGDAMGQKIRLRLAKKIARDFHLKLVENWPMERIGVDCVILEVRDARSIGEVIEDLSAVSGVAWSQPLNEFTVQSTNVQSYNDKLYRAQAVSKDWKLARLHRLATGRGVKIAIVDSRIDTGHPDLTGQISSTPDFVDVKRTRGEKHGTGVAGIIAARPNNTIGIAGVAPDAIVMGLRACWEKPAGDITVCNSLSLAKALVYAIESKADIINLSLAGPKDRLLEALVSQAISRGVTVVAAVDPDLAKSSFPATVPGVIPVGDERLSMQSAKVYIAPGQGVLTTEPEGKWSIVSGSSFAAAHVTGLLALLKQLSQKHRTGKFSTSVIGEGGAIDVCAAVARISSADARSCS